MIMSEDLFDGPTIYKHDSQKLGNFKNLPQVQKFCKLFEINNNNTTMNTSSSSSNFDEIVTKRYNWTFQSEKNGVKYFSRPSPFTAISASLFATFMPGVSALDVQLVIDDLPSHEKFDKLLARRSLIRRDPTNGKEYWRNEYKTIVWPIKARDVCTARVGKFFTKPELEEIGLPGLFDALGDGKRAFALFADNYDDFPEDSKNYQRALVATTMFVAMELEDGSGVFSFMVANIDPKGSIPSSVVSATLSAGMERTRLQREMIIEESKTRRLRNEKMNQIRK